MSESDTPMPTPSVAHLTLKRNGAETDMCFELHPPATIGRFDPSVGPIEVDLGGLPEGSYVSRRHAKFHFEDGVWKVLDLNSSNGTFVLRDGDFAKVDEAVLADGEEIAFGNARFVFHLGLPGEVAEVATEEGSASAVVSDDSTAEPAQEASSSEPAMAPES